MSASKSERLMNLVIALLVTRQPLTKERLRQTLEPYRACASEDAFEKMFERDKDDLRAMGIPVSTEYLDPFFADESGYRIRRDAFELPEISLSPSEAAVLGLAARVWQHAGLAEATTGALVKLQASGVPVDREAIDAVQPRLVAQEPAFEPMLQATTTRTQVEFDYRRPDAPERSTRRLQPWGVVTAQDRWYVVGWDLDREDTRMFRLSRVLGEVRTVGSPGAYAVPAGTDIRALSRSLHPGGEPRQATVLARRGAAAALRRRATSTQPVDRAPGSEGQWDRLEVSYRDGAELLRTLLALGSAVRVEQPDDLREQVRARLEQLLSATGAPS